ncbi:hypothetical protein [Haloactinospora alba]|nr:hypothetical protein [Haloactinospora alba]
MGEMRGRSSSKDRYSQAEVTTEDKLILEGVEGEISYAESALGRTLR